MYIRTLSSILLALSPLSPSSGFEQVNKRLQLVGTGLLLLEQGHEVMCSPVIRLQGCNLSAAVGEGTLQLSELGALGHGQSLQLGAGNGQLIAVCVC